MAGPALTGAQHTASSASSMRRTWPSPSRRRCPDSHVPPFALHRETTLTAPHQTETRGSEVSLPRNRGFRNSPKTRQGPTTVSTPDFPRRAFSSEKARCTSGPPGGARLSGSVRGSGMFLTPTCPRHAASQRAPLLSRTLRAKPPSARLCGEHRERSVAPRRLLSAS
jgi:hypothetical protein